MRQLVLGGERRDGGGRGVSVWTCSSDGASLHRLTYRSLGCQRELLSSQTFQTKFPGQIIGWRR